MSKSPRRQLLLAASSIVSVIALAGCGSAGPTQTDADGAIVVNNCGYEQSFTEVPERVVILNGASVGEVESFIVLGIEDSIVANAQKWGVSDDPGMVQKIADLPTGGVELNDSGDIPAEQLIALDPDLVISTWAGGFEASNGMATRDELAEIGANTLVNPVNCALGKPSASPQEKATMANAGVESSYEFLTLLGDIFKVRAKANATVSDMQKRIATASDAVQNRDPVTAIIAFPSMTAMTTNGVPGVMIGGIYDDVLVRAGGKPAFAGSDNSRPSTMSAEQLAKADVELLVLGVFGGEVAEDEAKKIFDANPDWPASKSKSYVALSDGLYLGPMNPIAIDKIAKTAHPDAF